jgi:hypothetical protein
MNEKVLRGIWGTLGSALLVFAAACFLRTTGAKLIESGIKQNELDPHAVPLLAIPVIWILAILVMRATREHARLVIGRDPQASWAQRLPIFYFDPSDVAVDERLGRLYQRYFLALFLVVPVIVMLHQFGLLLEADAMLDGDLLIHGWKHLSVVGIDWSRWLTDYRLAGLQYYPVIEPWIFVAMILHVAWRLGGSLRSLFGSATSVGWPST